MVLKNTVVGGFVHLSFVLELGQTASVAWSSLPVVKHKQNRLHESPI
jgi:hypothetical protein